MFYDIENFKKRIGNSTFYLDIYSSLNKNERYFLNYLLKKYIEMEDLKIEISKDEFFENFKMDSGELNSFLEKLSRKNIGYFFIDSMDDIRGSFNFINSYMITQKSFIVNIPKDIKYSKYIKIIYSFSNRITYKFYGHFIKNFILKKNFQVKIEEFKDILKIDNRYERFFDFEKNILKPLIKDLEIPYKIEFDKVKVGTNLNNKVIAIDFKFRDPVWEDDDDMKLKSILFMIKGDIEDISEVYTILKNGIKDHGYETTYRTCFKVKQRYKSINMSFDEVLKISFKKLDLKDVEPIVIIKKHFASPKELRKMFMNELEKVKPGVILDTSFFCEKFLQDFILLKEDKVLSFRNSEISLFINWKQNEESTIKIFLL